MGFAGVSNHYSRPNIPLNERESRKVADFLELALEHRFKQQSTPWREKLAMLENNLVDHPIFLGLFGIHDVVALDVFLDLFHRLPAVLCQQRIDG